MFAAIASGNPLQLSVEVPNSSGLQHTIVLSRTKPKLYSHITLFILPNVTFPQDFVATVYFKLSPQEEFKLFGYLSGEKPSAIFKVQIPSSKREPGEASDGLGEIDMDVDDGSGANDMSADGNGSNNISELIIGISIEPREQGMMKLEEWKASMNGEAQKNNSLVLSRPNLGVIRNITTAGQLAQVYPSLTQELAAKIVQHAYNYLSGFLDSQGNVPIKRFDTWWDKFKNRLANDGTFLDEVTKN
ncbi:Opi10p [Saccharomyces eubayanus]|uniref:Opi10p n=1 Tax=Saccharomyces eubayanus TaxID=1080349 RepID=UPI0006C5B6FB|nr:OPI10-like protein [Saccharomyces eubayanus]KOG99036.1 OPI10-like protein [Saccharomyces eubayanus]